MKRYLVLLTALIAVIATSCEKDESLSITILPDKITVAEGETYQLTAKLKGGGGSSVIWNSLSPDVAVVDDKGMVTALGPGNAVITAQPGGAELLARCEVTVNAAPYRIIIDETATLYRGDTYKLVARISGEPEIKDPVIKWESGSEEIVSVGADGTLTAIKTGDTYVTASLHGYSTVTATCRVYVLDPVDITWQYRLFLSGKGSSGYSASRPEEFLSARALERRHRQNISVDESDLPISDGYISDIENTGAVVIGRSKWLTTVTVDCYDPSIADALEDLPFVDRMEHVGTGTWKRDDGLLVPAVRQETAFAFDAAHYGDAWPNINVNKGQLLHESGYTGDGIHIAVLDSGFEGVDSYSWFDGMNVLGNETFVYKFEMSPEYVHGMSVLGCMAVNKAGEYVGTAPDAGYWLLLGESEDIEQPVEQDYWVTALEYADSVGVDLVNTSVGWTGYDEQWGGLFPPEDMDGETIFATRASNAAYSKGMLIVAAVGNNHTRFSSPSDSPGVLAVGGIYADGEILYSSSRGYTEDGRIKPDVVALGMNIKIIGHEGPPYLASGTSFSSPIICGLAACIWEAFPTLTCGELRDVIVRSSDRFDTPVLPFGYGIPDMERAMEIAAVITAGR